ncbi:hypothetical protein B0H11DRAFT_2027395 [Mycena galericulata]|nr:hypothetical protein B0H11DRAFT_2027395 [Mycena galericulata]
MSDRSISFPSSWCITSSLPCIAEKDWNIVNTGIPQVYNTSWETWNDKKHLVPRRSNRPSNVHLFVTHYYGVHGCIVPIACSDHDPYIVRLAFTIAGPPIEGKKPFYLLIMADHLSGSSLWSLGDLSSIAEFRFPPVHEHREILPVEGGYDAMEAAYHSFNSRPLLPRETH